METEEGKQQVSVLNFGAVNPSMQAINSEERQGEQTQQAFTTSDLALRSQAEEEKAKDPQADLDDETLS